MNQSETIIKKWIANREFLDEIGKLYEAVWEICLPFEDDAVDIPNWAVYQEAFSKGTPILAHEKFQLPLQKRAAYVFQALTNLAENEKIPSVFREKCIELQNICEQYPTFAEAIIGSMLYQQPLTLEIESELSSLNQGLLYFFVWVSITTALVPYRPTFEKWQQEQAWQGNVCPTCGGVPATAVLKRGQKGRQRYLVCHRCQTEWAYKRIGCPYCGNTEQKQLEILEIVEEPDLRVDICHACKHYIKTYTGRTEAAAAVVDCLSLHLDILCQQQGYVKKAALIMVE